MRLEGCQHEVDELMARLAELAEDGPALHWLIVQALVEQHPGYPSLEVGRQQRGGVLKASVRLPCCCSGRLISQGNCLLPLLCGACHTGGSLAPGSRVGAR